MRYFVLFCIFFTFFFLEASLTSIPLVLLYFLVLSVIFRNERIIFFAFLAGFFLDSATVRPIGITSLFLMLFLFLVFVYERKFETASYQFIFFASFFGAFFYLLFTKQYFALPIALVSSILGIIFFACAKWLSLTQRSE